MNPKINLTSHQKNQLKVIDKIVDQISKNLELNPLDPYLIDSVSLIAANASLSKCNKIKTWQLKR